jgi:hypothetical protein
LCDFGRGKRASRAQRLAHQRDRMRLQRQADAGIVGGDVVEQAGLGQGHCVFGDARLAEHRGRRGQGFHVPARAVAVARETAQRIGVGQTRLFEAIQRGAFDQVAHVGEGPHATRFHDAFGAGLRQAVDLA